MRLKNVSNLIEQRAAIHARPAPPCPPIEVMSGSTLCRLRVWSEEEWAALGDKERPLQVAHVPGLGWVGAVPVASMN